MRGFYSEMFILHSWEVLHLSRWMKVNVGANWKMATNIFKHIHEVNPPPPHQRWNKQKETGIMSRMLWLSHMSSPKCFFMWYHLYMVTFSMWYLQGRSACGVTRSLRTAATQWWSSSSEPSCTPRTANSSTSSAPEFQVKYRSYIRMQQIKNVWALLLSAKCLSDGGEKCMSAMSMHDLGWWAAATVCVCFVLSMQ